MVGVERPEAESLALYVVVSTTTSGCTTIDCIEDWTEGADECQDGGSSVIVVRDGPLGRGADLPAREDLSQEAVDLRGCIGEDFGEGVDRRSGCSNGLT